MLLQLMFVAVSLFKLNKPILSQTAVGIAGVLLVTVTNAAALGFCAVFGIAFNASSTHVSSKTFSKYKEKIFLKYTLYFLNNIVFIFYFL